MSWRFRLLAVEVFLWKGQFAESNALLADEPPAGSPSEIAARREILQGRALCRLGKSPDSAFDQAAQIIQPTEKYLQAELAFARGKCASMTSLAKALTYYQASADLAQGVDSFEEAKARVDVGNILLHDGQYPKAIHEFEEVIKLTDAMLLTDRALGDLGFAYSQLGEFQRAISFSKHALEIAQQIHNKPAEENWRIDLGREQFAQMKFTEARSAFRDAMMIAKGLGDRNGEGLCLHNLAQLALRTKDLPGAEDYISQLEQLKPQGTRSLDLLLDQAELARSKADLPVAERLLTELSEKMLSRKDIEPTARWTAQSDLALVYDAERKFDLAETMFKKAIATAIEAWTNCSGVECKISFLDQAPFFDRYVRFLVGRNRALEALDVAELGRSPTLSEGLEPGERRFLRGARLRSIQQRLGTQHSIVLAYWLGWEESYLWVVTPSTIQLFRLPAEPEIEKRADAYNQAILGREEREELHTGERLYDTLIRPAATLIPKGSNVVIVPHRKLYNLNFETIPVPGPTPRFWIEDVHLQNASFLGALASTRALQPGSTAKGLLLIGAPLQAVKQFPVLKYAAAEMKKVAGHFPSSQQTIISGGEAVPDAYAAASPGQFEFIHFVTHGTSSTVLESPLDSSIILSVPKGPSAVPADSDPYRLQGRAIMQTPLRARLVTISACYGLGREYSGEGLVGLAWAFLRAGAHQVIAALWEVDDTSTPQLMDDFYDELTHGKSAAEALRDAKLKMLHSGTFYRHPYYWASLQLYTGS